MENQELNNNEVNNGAAEQTTEKEGVLSRAVKGIKHVVVKAKA